VNSGGLVKFGEEQNVFSVIPDLNLLDNRDDFQLVSDPEEIQNNFFH